MVVANYSSSASLAFFLGGSSASSFSSSFLRFLFFSVEWEIVTKGWLGIAGEAKQEFVVGLGGPGAVPQSPQ